MGRYTQKIDFQHVGHIFCYSTCGLQQPCRLIRDSRVQSCQSTHTITHPPPLSLPLSHSLNYCDFVKQKGLRHGICCISHSSLLSPHPLSLSLPWLPIESSTNQLQVIIPPIKIPNQVCYFVLTLTQTSHAHGFGTSHWLCQHTLYMLFICFSNCQIVLTPQYLVMSTRITTTPVKNICCHFIFPKITFL